MKRILPALMLCIVNIGCKSATPNLVGHYEGGSVVGEEAKAEADKTPLAAPLVSMLGNVTLDLKEDHTFRYTTVFSMEGKWELVDQEVVLHPSEFGAGFLPAIGSQEANHHQVQMPVISRAKFGDIRLKVGNSGELTIIGSKGDTSSGTPVLRKAPLPSG